VGAHSLRESEDLAARTLHSVSRKFLQRTFDEFAFRFDRRRRETELSIDFCTARSTLRSVPINN